MRDWLYQVQERYSQSLTCREVSSRARPVNAARCIAVRTLACAHGRSGAARDVHVTLSRHSRSRAHAPTPQPGSYPVLASVRLPPRTYHELNACPHASPGARARDLRSLAPSVRQQSVAVGLEQQGNEADQYDAVQRTLGCAYGRMLHAGWFVRVGPPQLACRRRSHQPPWLATSNRASAGAG